MPLFGVDIIELSRRQNLIIISQTSSDQDPSTGLQLNIETSMITPASTVISIQCNSKDDILYNMIIRTLQKALPQGYYSLMHYGGVSIDKLWMKYNSRHCDHLPGGEHDW